MDMKKLKKWKLYQTENSGPLPELSETGKLLRALKIGESLVTPWTDGKRPKASAETMIGNRRWKLEPQDDGLKWTRLE